VTRAEPAQPNNRFMPGPLGACALAFALLSGLLITALTPGIGLAQTARPNVSVSATIPAEPASQMPLVIRVGPPDALPKGTFVRVRGLPPMAALSEGHSIAPGSWAVPIAALPNLKITLPVAAAGKSEISITLVGIDGAVLGEAKSILVVAASPTAENKNAAAPLSILRAGTPAQVAPDQPDRPPVSLPSETGPKMAPAERERAMRLVKKGDEQLADGGIAQARLLYERAAEAGLAEGAMALASTYDTAELGRLGVRGLQPDAAAARRWYERAQQLGAAEAAQRLRRLGAN
jgi:hypothetical protein